MTLFDILAARERRAERQKKLLSEYGSTLVSFTMNIAGPVKSTPLIERAFAYGLSALRARLPRDRGLFESITSDFCGCEAILAVDLDANEAKNVCVTIEESSRLGRLFDMDVIDSTGRKLDRAVERPCIVCGKAGRECAAGRIHPVDQIVDVSEKIMEEHFARLDAEQIGRLAADCLIKEVETTPKPGLVDQRNCGSHDDMDVEMFYKSVEAIGPYLASCVRIGINGAKNTAKETFDSLRSAGLEAEKAMYEVTGGVNTHKGAIYSMGVLLGALGRLWKADRPIAEVDKLLREAASLVRESSALDLSRAKGATAGEQLYLERGLRGIRGEAATGFSSVVKHGLPIYERCLAKSFSSNDAGVCALLSLISSVEDTNLYHRGGEEGSDFAKEYAKRLLQGSFDRSAVEQMDREFIKRHLSPGGSADLLAVTYFMHEIKFYE